VIGTLKIYARMYALRLRRGARRHRHQRILAGGIPAWAVTLHSPRNGLFAHLTWCLALWARAQKQGSRITIRGTSPQYGREDGSVDWFGTLFLNREPVQLESPRHELTMREYEEWPEFNRGEGSRSLAEAAALFHRYSGLRPEIVTEVEQFCATHWGPEQVLGVHYRGTDKRLEAPPVSMEAMIAHVKAAVALWPELKTIFVATDEERFPLALRLALPGHRIVSVDGVLRSSSDQAVHHMAGVDGLARARQAVFDCAVLSRTTLVLKTASMLSGWSGILSPKLPMILVNPPYAHANFFPDCLLPDRMSDLPARIASLRAEANQ
jgi:hypothetical protein